MPVQPWEIIEKNKLNYYQGTILKYLLRYNLDTGGGLDDLLKARSVLNELIRVTEGQPSSPITLWDIRESSAHDFYTEARPGDEAILPDGSRRVIAQYRNYPLNQWLCSDPTCPLCYVQS